MLSAHLIVARLSRRVAGSTRVDGASDAVCGSTTPTTCTFLRSDERKVFVSPPPFRVLDDALKLLPRNHGNEEVGAKCLDVWTSQVKELDM